MQKPTIGRIVHYKSRGSADGKYPSVARAAIITDVEASMNEEKKASGMALIESIDYKVKLTVFNPEGIYLTPVWVEQGDNAGEWNWPPRE